MSDLISREETLRAIDSLGEDYISYYKLLMLIGRLPSAEPERKKGHWLPHPGDEDLDVCSVCGTGCKRRERGISQYIPWVTEYNYQFCPNCGAEMTR